MTMDARKQRVLQAIVALYGLEGEPVGSSVLANYFDMAVSSATLRNEMAALTKLGPEPVFEKMYQAAAAAQQAAGAQPGPDAGANNQQKPGDDGVVDADFKEV